jgi:hypothetical protein
MPKFELYKHNDELFNNITGFSMNFELLPFLSWRPSWIQDGADGHHFEREPPKDHFSKVWLRLAQ